MFSGPLSDPFHLFAYYVAANALILLVLGALVVRGRMRYGVGIGDGGLPQMGRVIRAHGNNAEYTPMAMLLMWALVPLGTPVWLIHAVGAPFTLGRLLHGLALSQNEGPSALRLIGMVLTYIAYIAGIAGVIWLAIVPAAVAS